MKTFLISVTFFLTSIANAQDAPKKTNQGPSKQAVQKAETNSKGHAYSGKGENAQQGAAQPTTQPATAQPVTKKKLKKTRIKEKPVKAEPIEKTGN
jgi:hypothetical protein